MVWGKCQDEIQGPCMWGEAAQHHCGLKKKLRSKENCNCFVFFKIKFPLKLIIYNLIFILKFDSISLKFIQQNVI